LSKTFGRRCAHAFDEIMVASYTLLPIDCPLAVEREAQRIAALLLARRGVTLPAPEPVSKTGSPLPRPPSVTTAPSAPAAPSPTSKASTLPSLELHRPEVSGVEHVGSVGDAAVRVHELLTSLGINGGQCTTIIGSYFARMAAPGRNCERIAGWARPVVWGSCLDVDYENAAVECLCTVPPTFSGNAHAALEHSRLPRLAICLTWILPSPCMTSPTPISKASPEQPQGPSCALQGKA